MVSGGADSVALLTGLAEVLGPERLVVLHVNYGLREEADADEELVAQLCGRLGVELEVVRAGRAEGNIEAWAREIRHREAERIRAGRELDWIAVGHNRSDAVETFLYRLASSPGVRPLLAMPPRSGRLIRPLLSLDRKRIRSIVEGVAPYAEDETNQDPSFARNRIRLEVIPTLERVNSGAQANIIRTRSELEEDEEALMDEAIAAVGSLGEDSSDGLPAELLSGSHPAVRRRMIRHLAEGELGRPVAISRHLAAEAVRLAAAPEGGSLDLGGGDYLLAEGGRLRVISGDDVDAAVPEPIRVNPAGLTYFGAWEIVSSCTTEEEARPSFGNPWAAFLDAEGLGEWLAGQPSGPDDLALTLRPWRVGDRVEPLGMSGSKKLQDVFTDALVPASKRRTWPVLVIGPTVIWVPGLVRSKHLLISHPERSVQRLEATPPERL